jgi:signal transduction histidine kinase
MDRLIQDLLDVTRMESGRFSVERAPLHVDAIVEDSLEGQRAIANAAEIELRSDIAPDGGDVFADHDRLCQVLENLIGNAVRFTPPLGSVTVGASPREREGEVLFWVADTGTGIPAEELPRVFDRFWQGRKHGGGGAGLGLAIVKGIVEAHGGRVWAESNPGRGTTFFFTIPTQPRAGDWHPAHA